MTSTTTISSTSGTCASGSWDCRSGTGTPRRRRRCSGGRHWPGTCRDCAVRARTCPSPRCSTARTKSAHNRRHNIPIQSRPTKSKQNRPQVGDASSAPVNRINRVAAAVNFGPTWMRCDQSAKGCVLHAAPRRRLFGLPDWLRWPVVLSSTRS